MNRITLEPGKRGGKPCIRILRTTVYDVLTMLSEGMTVQEILEDFPERASSGRRHRLFAQFKLGTVRGFVDPVRFHWRFALKMFNKDRNSRNETQYYDDPLLDCEISFCLDGLL